MKAEFIVYKVVNGIEQFIELGTVEEIAKMLCLTTQQVRQRAADCKRNDFRESKEGNILVYGVGKLEVA